MDSTTVLVTALYEYDKTGNTKFAPHIAINCPMIILTTRKLEYKIWYERPSYCQTIVIVVDTPDFLNHTLSPYIRAYECLQLALNSVPKNTKYLVWVDSSKFKDMGHTFNYKIRWPNAYKLKELFNSSMLQHIGPIFNLKKLSDTVSSIPNIWFEYATGNIWVDTGINLGDIATNNVKAPPHNICKQIKLLTVASINITGSQFEKWEFTAKAYGYNYEILGRDNIWMGFTTKIKLCHARLNTITEPITVISDCTDVIITGCSDELYTAFMSMGQDIIVGGESMPYYINGSYTQNKVAPYFDSIRQSDQKYPNGGFIMGYTKALQGLFQHIIHRKDDQAAYFDTIYDHKVNIAIDYHTKLVGNMPNYHHFHIISENYFEYDPVLGRYKNRCNQNTPIFLHFPGKYTNIMNYHYETIYALPISNNSASSQYFNWWSFSIIIVLIIIILLLVYSILYKY